MWWAGFLLGICTNSASRLGLGCEEFFEWGLYGDLDHGVEEEMMSEFARCPRGGIDGTFGTNGICDIFGGPLAGFEVALFWEILDRQWSLVPVEILLTLCSSDSLR